MEKSLPTAINHVAISQEVVKYTCGSCNGVLVYNRRCHTHTVGTKGVNFIVLVNYDSLGIQKGEKKNGEI